MFSDQKGTWSLPDLGPLEPKWGLALVLAITVGGTLLHDHLTAPPDRVPISYTAFRTQLEDDNVEAVSMIEGRGIEGTLRDSVALGDEGEAVRSDAFRARLPIADSEQLLADLEAADVTIRARGESMTWLTFITRFGPTLVLIALIVFLVQHTRGALDGGLFDAIGGDGRSGRRPDTTFDDVAGCEEAKEEVSEVVEFLQSPEKFTRLGGKLPSGVLLVGPPGTGKTLLARAIAGEASAAFHSLNGSEFLELYVGVGAKRVRKLFAKARANAPAIVFIDELDAIGRSRGGSGPGNHGEQEQTLNQLLVEMDGFEGHEGVVVIGATNRPDVLDPALLRPGRFDRQVEVGTPDRAGREAILEVHTRDLPLAADVDLDVLARTTPGLSGAELENLVNEAALLAARRGAGKIFHQDLEKAKDKELLGTERRSLVLSEQQRRLTAYHEAGHALVALRRPELDPVHKVTIVPHGRALGVTASLPEEDRHNYTRAYLTGKLAMMFGGRMAELLVFGPDQVTTGAQNDIQQATRIARKMVTEFGMSDRVGLRAVEMEGRPSHTNEQGFRERAGSTTSQRTAEIVDEEIDRLLETGQAEARRLLTEARGLLDRLAAELMEHESLGRAEVEALAAEEGFPVVEGARPHRCPAGTDEAS